MPSIETPQYQVRVVGRRRRVSPSQQYWVHDVEPFGATLRPPQAALLSAAALALCQPGEHVMAAFYPLGDTTELLGKIGWVDIVERRFARRSALGKAFDRRWVVGHPRRAADLPEVVQSGWNNSGNETLLLLIGDETSAGAFAGLYVDDMETEIDNAVQAAQFFPTVINRGHDGKWISVVSAVTDVTKVVGSFRKAGAHVVDGTSSTQAE